MVFYQLIISMLFLSSNAQDFIEDSIDSINLMTSSSFLSSNAQDFIEDRTVEASGS